MTTDTATKPADDAKVEETPSKHPLDLVLNKLDTSLTQLTVSNSTKVVRRWLTTTSTSKYSLEDYLLVFVRYPDDKFYPLLAEVGFMNDNLAAKASESSYELLKTIRYECYLYLMSQVVSLIEDRTVSYRLVVEVLKQVEQETRLAPSAFPLIARLVRFYALTSYQLASNNQQIKESLFNLHRSAVLRNDADTTATCLYLLLSHLMMVDGDLDGAYKLKTNAAFPEEAASNNQMCRYLYYTGLLGALRLEYTEAYAALAQCWRKCAPNTEAGGSEADHSWDFTSAKYKGISGFRLAVLKLKTSVQLLMGEIPERSVFDGKGHFRTVMQPYFELTQAVRRGSLSDFRIVIATHDAVFSRDRTKSLVNRLYHSVVKAGLRRIVVSYSRISLLDVAEKLSLSNAEPASVEFIVMKAIRDGIIDATIVRDDEAGVVYLNSNEYTDVYTKTMDPTDAFHRRIVFLLNLRNEAMRGMRYPPDEYKAKLAESQRRRGKKKATLVLEDLDDSDFDDDDDF